MGCWIWKEQTENFLFSCNLEDLNKSGYSPQLTLFFFIIISAKSLQSCLTLCDRIDGSPLGSPVPGILQARTLEWVAISFSSAWKWKLKVKSFNRAWLLATPWPAAYQAPPSMGFSRQEYWSGVPLPSPNDLQFTTFHEVQSDCEDDFPFTEQYWSAVGWRISASRFFGKCFWASLFTM